MNRNASMSLHFLPASASPLVLVIRRGPSKSWHFLMWDRDTGIVTPGSWFNGLVFPHRCDLSPKGDWMLLLAYRGGKQPVAWTALCQPPSVKAIVFWPQENAKVGGGFFDDRAPVAWIQLPHHTPPPEVHGPHPYEFSLAEPEDEAYGSVPDRLERAGWRREKQRGKPKESAVSIHWFKESPDRHKRLWVEFAGTDAELLADPTLFAGERLKWSHQFKARPEERAPLGGVTWADWNSRSHICFAEDGRLLRRDPDEPATEPFLVFDLNGMAPPRSLSPARPAALSGGTPT